MNIHIRIAAVSLLLAVGTACGMGGGPPGGGQMGGPMGQMGGKKAEPVTVVEIDEVATGSVADVLAASATVESEAAADLVPVSPGIVVSVHKDEGDVVKKGDLLAVLDNVSLDASAERAASELRRLEDQYNQMEQLASQGAVSSRELADLRYQLEGARTSMREASRSKGQTRLTAPFDGVVAKRDVRVGEYASGVAAFQVVDPNDLRVVASLPERDLPRVAVGQPATLTSAYDEDRKATGSVARISPVVDASSGTFRVTVNVDPDQNVLRPGQFVTVDLEVDRRRDVVVVPRKAIVYEDGSPVVYVYDVPTEEELAEAAEKEAKGAWGGGGKGGWGDKKGSGEGSDGGGGWFAGWFGGEEEKKADEDEGDDEGPGHIARRTPVELGLVDDDMAEISEGLEVGDQVIVVGQSHLRDMAKVRDAQEVKADQDDADEDEDTDTAEVDVDDDADEGENG